MSQPAEPLSVVVPTRDRTELLGRCLDALRASVAPIDEIVVVDSASRDGRVREVAAQSGARYVRCDEPGGSLARNVGWRAASHDVVAFVDDDIRVEQGWAETIRANFRSDADLGFVTGAADVPAGQEEIDLPLSVEVHDAAHDLVPGDPRPRGISGNFAARRTALERVGGFDEALGPGRRFRASEDKDLFDRFLAADVRGRYEPAVRVLHDQWRSRGQRLRIEWSYGIGAGARVAKLVRTDRRLARAVARDVFVRWGLGTLGHALRHRYETAAIAALLRLTGAALGFLMGIAVPVRGGHYATSRRRA